MLFRMLFLGLLIGSTAAAAGAAGDADSWRIVPTPKQFRIEAGRAELMLDGASYWTDDSCRPAARLLNEEWKRLFGKDLIERDAADSIHAAIRLKIVPTNKTEGYTLRIAAEGIELTGDDAAGIVHAVMTLVDLLESNAAQVDGPRLSIPEGCVRDWPDLPVRGMDFQWCFYAPSLEFMRDTAGVLARGKFNILIPELGSQYRSEREAGLFKDAKISREEFRSLVAHATQRGLQVVPKISVLGHAERGMVWPAPLEDGPDLSDESNYAALFNVMQEYIDDVRAAGGKAEYFHVGMDEASKTLLANMKKTGRPGGELLARHAQRVHAFLSRRKIRMVMYHDMLIGSGEKGYWREMGTSHADATESWRARPDIPRDVVLDYWNYEAFPRYRTVEGLIEEGFTFWLTPWMGDAVRSMSRAAITMRQPGVVGSTWSDSNYSFPADKGPTWTAIHTRRWVSDAIGATAEYSWNANTPRIIERTLSFDPTAWLARQYWSRRTRDGGDKMTALRLASGSPDMKKVGAEIRNYYGLPAKTQLQGVVFDLQEPIVFGSMNSICLPSRAKALAAPLPWTVSVNHQPKLTVTGVNRPRNANDVILYTREYGFTTGASGYGGEAVVKNGIVEYKSDWGAGNEPIPRNGFVLSAHGEGLYTLNGINSGDEVQLTDAGGAVLNLSPFPTQANEAGTPVEIPLDPAVTGVFLLHSTIYENASYGEPVATITVYLENGAKSSYDLIYGRDLCAFDEAKLISGRSEPRRWLAASVLGDGLGRGACLYAWQWTKSGSSPKRIEISPTHLGLKLGYTVLGVTVEH